MYFSILTQGQADDDLNGKYSSQPNHLTLFAPKDTHSRALPTSGVITYKPGLNLLGCVIVALHWPLRNDLICGLQMNLQALG